MTADEVAEIERKKKEEAGELPVEEEVPAPKDKRKDSHPTSTPVRPPANAAAPASLKRKAGDGGEGGSAKKSKAGSGVAVERKIANLTKRIPAPPQPTPTYDSEGSHDEDDDGDE